MESLELSDLKSLSVFSSLPSSSVVGVGFYRDIAKNKVKFSIAHKFRKKHNISIILISNLAERLE